MAAIKEVDIKNLIARNEVKVIGNKILAIPRRTEEKFFKIELDLEEEEIDKIVEEEIAMWTE
ncbi:hypothetical protein C5S31_11445 [ANME-1 cluster archaeon GoMg2]|nr:hypothetical protein [ANME-1 cluster archaeon GoMg2]